MPRLVTLIFLAGSTLLSQVPGEALQRLVQAGEVALKERRYTDAEAAYEKVRQLSPETAEVHATLGVIYFQQRKFQEAVSALNQALKLKPALARADALLAMSLSELGRFGDALPGLRKAFAQSSNAALKRQAGLQLERAYAGLEQDDKAVEVALEMRRLYPNDAEVLYHTGKLFGNFAYLTMRRLAEVAPSSVWRHLAAGEAHQSQGNYDQAISEYREVLKADPQRPGVHFRVGRVLQLRAQKDKTQLQDAAIEFEKELQIDPTNANAAYELGEMLRKSGEFAKARQYFGRALEHYPDFAEAHLGLSATLLALGEHTKALQHVQKAVKLNPEDEVAYYRLSVVYRAVGNAAEQQKALAEFKRIRQQKTIRSADDDIFGPREITKQEVDSEVGGER